MASAGDLSALLIAGPFDEYTAKVRYRQIMSEMIDVFGLPPLYKAYLTQLNQAIKHFDKSINGGRKAYEVHAQLALLEAEKLLPEGETNPKQSFGKSLVAVSKKMGFRVNPKEVTVFEYYTYLRDGG